MDGVRSDRGKFLPDPPKYSPIPWLPTDAFQGEPAAASSVRTPRPVPGGAFGPLLLRMQLQNEGHQYFNDTVDRLAQEKLQRDIKQTENHPLAPLARPEGLSEAMSPLDFALGTWLTRGMMMKAAGKALDWGAEGAMRLGGPVESLAARLDQSATAFSDMLNAGQRSIGRTIRQAGEDLARVGARTDRGTRFGSSFVPMAEADVRNLATHPGLPGQMVHESQQDFINALQAGNEVQPRFWKVYDTPHGMHAYDLSRQGYETPEDFLNATTYAGGDPYYNAMTRLRDTFAFRKSVRGPGDYIANPVGYIGDWRNADPARVMAQVLWHDAPIRMTQAWADTKNMLARAAEAYGEKTGQQLSFGGSFPYIHRTPFTRLEPGARSMDFMPSWAVQDLHTFSQVPPTNAAALEDFIRRQQYLRGYSSFAQPVEGKIAAFGRKLQQAGSELENQYPEFFDTGFTPPAQIGTAAPDPMAVGGSALEDRTRQLFRDYLGGQPVSPEAEQQIRQLFPNFTNPTRGLSTPRTIPQVSVADNSYERGKFLQGMFNDILQSKGINSMNIQQERLLSSLYRDIARGDARFDDTILHIPLYGSANMDLGTFRLGNSRFGRVQVMDKSGLQQGDLPSMLSLSFENNPQGITESHGTVFTAGGDMMSNIPTVKHRTGAGSRIASHAPDYYPTGRWNTGFGEGFSGDSQPLYMATMARQVPTGRFSFDANDLTLHGFNFMGTNTALSHYITDPNNEMAHYVASRLPEAQAFVAAHNARYSPLFNGKEPIIWQMESGRPVPYYWVPKVTNKLLPSVGGAFMLKALYDAQQQERQ